MTRRRRPAPLFDGLPPAPAAPPANPAEVRALHEARVACQHAEACVLITACSPGVLDLTLRAIDGLAINPAERGLLRRWLARLAADVELAQQAGRKLDAAGAGLKSEAAPPPPADGWAGTVPLAASDFLSDAWGWAEDRALAALLRARAALVAELADPEAKWATRVGRELARATLVVLQRAVVVAEESCSRASGRSA